MRTLFLLTLAGWKLVAQSPDASITMTTLGQAYDTSAASLLVFTGTPGAAHVTLKTLIAPDGKCLYSALAALWYCVSADGQVSVSSSGGSSPKALDVPAGPSELIMSGSGSALAFWYVGPQQLYLVTAGGSAVRMMQFTAPVAELLAVSDDGALVLARGHDACAWLLGPDDSPRCLQNERGAVAGTFAAGRRILFAYRKSAKVYLAQPPDYAAQLLAGAGDGIVEPVAVLGAGDHAFVADHGAGVIHAIDWKTGTARAIRSPAAPSQFVPIGTGRYLTTNFASGSLILLETGPAARVAAATLTPRGGQ